MKTYPALLMLLVVICLATVSAAHASVELAWSGNKPQVIDEVYLHQGVSYLAIDDVLSALGMRGDWSAVEHKYFFRTPEGRASLFPGGKFLKVNDRFLPLEHSPLFLDGRFRVAEDFVLVQLPLLAGKTVFYRNLNSQVPTAGEDDSPLDKLFAFLLQKKQVPGTPLRGVAIDVGHGGGDPGTLGLHGVKEKDLVLQIATRLEKKIKMELGIPVYLSRDGDYRLTQEQRLATAAKPDVDLFVLLHAEAAFSPETQGINLFVRPEEAAAGDQAQLTDDSDSMKLALATRQHLVEAGYRVNQVFQAPLLPLGRGDLPTVLVELGYLSNNDDYQYLTTATGQKQLADSLFAGLRQFAEEKRTSHR
jgi:N-acetylmuramoyl-L-alanine amidase